MTHRENLLRLYRRQGYAFAPVEFNLCTSQYKTFKEKTGSDDYARYFDFSVKFISGVSKKTHPAETYLKYYPSGLKEGAVIDTWGVAHEPGSAAAHHMTYMRHPLSEAQSVADIEAYELPEVLGDNAALQASEVEDIHNAGYAAGAGLECTIWESAWYIRSMEALMMDMISGDEMATVMLDRITDRSVKLAEAHARAGVDIIRTGDDIGMQHSIMMSKELYREWLKPRLKKVIDAAKSIKPDILIQYHSCGYVEPFIDDLIDAGIDILNPIQPECMNFIELSAKYGDRLSFNGTLGTQSVLPFGTPNEVEAAVRKHLDAAGDMGGLLCCPTHVIEPEVPWENLMAYVGACKRYK